MATKAVENPDRLLEPQAGLVRQSMAYGLSVIATGATMFFCTAIYILFMMWLPHAARASLLGFLAVIAVLFAILIGILAAACYRLIPLYLQYRRTRKQDEEMFP